MCDFCLKAGGRLEEAVTSYDTALQLRPGFVQALGGLIHAKTCLCDWVSSPRITAASPSVSCQCLCSLLSVFVTPMYVYLAA